ncbi:MAG: hypothetical protein Q6373_000660 [Candidatus Sigynarchaeota archaeon]
MTGIIYYQAKNDHTIPENLHRVAEKISHRGKHYLCIIDDKSCFAAAFLNKPQKNNLMIVDGTPEGMTRSFSILDGSIDVGTGLAEKQSTQGLRPPIEVIRTLYIKHGIEAFSQICGNFSILIKEKDELVIARDLFGSKPLYYVNDDEKIVVASELKAFCGISNCPNVLEPGTAFWTDLKASTIKRFHDARRFARQTRLQGIDAANAQVELRSLLDRAVRRSIPVNAKTASLLSCVRIPSSSCEIIWMHGSAMPNFSEKKRSFLVCSHG